MTTSTIIDLRCACCGTTTPARQWHNQDIGYGLCPKCADWIKTRETKEYMAKTYGAAGWHYGSTEKPLREDFQPTFMDGTDATEYQEGISGAISSCADAVSEADEIDEAQRILALNTPLEWSLLWAAMKAEPDRWVLTTSEMFDEMLGCVPPAAMKGGAFLVGEADRHNDEGKAVYAAFKKDGSKVYAKYLTRAEFMANV